MPRRFPDELKKAVVACQECGTTRLRVGYFRDLLRSANHKILMLERKLAEKSPKAEDCKP